MIIRLRWDGRTHTRTLATSGKSPLTPTSRELLLVTMDHHQLAQLANLQHQLANLQQKFHLLIQN